MENLRLKYEQLYENKELLQKNVSLAAHQSGRNAEDIMILAATKTQTVETVNAAVAMGIRYIGENRVQELVEKAAGYDRAHCQVHFIGHLQTNKVKAVVDKVDMIQSVDSLRLAQEIDRQCAKIAKTMEILVEVNIGREPAKSGVLPENLEQLLQEISVLPHLKVRGLMTIPPICAKETQSEHYFSSLHKEFLDIRAKKLDNINMDLLSMGMSGDYSCAIRSGATMIRVGTALFGSRKKQEDCTYGIDG